MRLTNLIMGLWAVTFVFSGEATGPDKYFLDLTIPQAEDSSVEDDVGWGGGVGSSSPPEVPLAVELKSVDKEVYSVGSDVLVYEVRVTNIGSTSVTIPWSPYRALVWKGYRPGMRLSGLEATIGLQILDRGHILALDARGLYSKLEDPKTFIILAPNESAVIKGSRRIELDPTTFTETKNKCAQLPKAMGVRASLNLTDWSQGRYYKRIESRHLRQIALNWSGCEK